MKSLKLEIEICKQIHNKKRKNGEEEYSHQLFVAQKAFNFTHSLSLSKISLFHDTLEDNPEKYHSIVERLLTEKEKLVIEKLTKKYNFGKTKEDYEEYHEKINCKESISIKAIDRIHNLITSSVFSNAKKEMYLEETCTYILPKIKTVNITIYTNLLKEIKKVENSLK